jgi:hypothetical protein
MLDYCVACGAIAFDVLPVSGVSVLILVGVSGWLVHFVALRRLGR